ncbi:MAG: hypothetical protein COA78_37025 [Blastopirellula sp.]|nr:MAG: hypothetical protein COA78_37025 [Blastopirellula sp.]
MELPTSTTFLPFENNKIMRSIYKINPFVLSISFCLASCVYTHSILQADENAGSPQVNFRVDVLPILSKNCLVCHGNDSESREADLRLDIFDGATADLGGYQAIVPGNSKESTAFQRIISDDADEKMPPPDAGHQMTEKEVVIIKNWIEQGADYEKHWAFEMPVKIDPPQVHQQDLVQNQIDAFVLAHLEEAGLKQSPQANRHVLIRRLYLDLIGIPPSQKQVEQFVEDRSNNAYEKVVDELLASKHYGEHWARMWLDLARYADSTGYEKDQERIIWRYRDWVINALNQDMPYSQFTLEQIAGDLLPNATMEQQLATAFHRNTMTNTEGGTDNEEFRTLAVKDRVDTTLQVWMGLTMGCAKCHSHKYDPISQTDYYRFYAYFNQTQDADLGNDPPRLSTPTTAQQAELDYFNQKLNALKQTLLKESPELQAARTKWESEIAQKNVWSVLHPTEVTSTGKATFKVLADNSVLVSGNKPAKDVYTLEVELPSTKVNTIRLEALTDPSLDKNGPGRNGGDPNFVVSQFKVEAITKDGKSTELKFNQAKANFSQKGWDVKGAIDDKIETGWAISPQQSKPHVAVFGLADTLENLESTKLKIAISQQYGNSLLLGRFRILASDQPFDSLDVALTSISEIAAIPSSKRSPAQQKQLAAAFRKVYPATANIQKQVDQLQKQMDTLVKQIPTTPVMRDLASAKQRKTHIHIRGNFLELGEPVSPALPHIFEAVSDDSSSSKSPDNRIAVANWLVSPNNPLTARVAVNRVWSRIFGRGIVETEEDFGTQGSLPSHPQLLDNLAVDFQKTQAWSLKQLCKSIVMSSTYQQSSHVTPEKFALDPQNRLLSRAPRYRLSAETIRDQALFASGLLSSKLGGPSVMPPQPSGIWKTTYSKLKWVTSPGEDRYRRGLYTFWRRTSPYPSMTTFDAVSREICSVRRIRTNIPLQALITMNDPVFVEAAGALASIMIHAENQSIEDRVTEGFRRVLVRPPNQPEVERLVQMYQIALSDFQSHPDSATRLLKSANITVDKDTKPVELAAWTTVANVLLNLDETLMRN